MRTKEYRPSRGLFSVLLGGGGLAFFVASCVSNGSNFLFHVIMSRILGPATYGALGSLLGVITIVTFAVGALQATVTQGVAERAGTGARGPLALRRHILQAGFAAAASLCVITALSPTIEHYLHLASPMPVIMLSLYVALTLLTLVPQGVLLGQLRFRVVALSLVGGALVRLGTGIVLTELGLGLEGALVASVLSACAVLFVLLWPLRHEVWNSSGDVVAIHLSSAALAVAALGGFATLVGVDSFLARHYLGGLASGEYVAAATGARIALFLPGAIALIAFPKFAAARGAGVEARRVLTTSLLAVAGLEAIAVGVMLLVPHLLISILFGAKYEQAAGALRILSLPAAGLGLISVLVYFYLAGRSLRSLFCWVGVALAVVLISLSHGSTEEIAWSMTFVTGITFALLGMGALIKQSRRVGEPLNHGSLLQRDTADLDLSIVVPYFNPGAQVRRTVDQIVAVLSELDISFEIITVSDGSTDGSEETLVGLSSQDVHHLRLPSNQGKGQALRVGLGMGRGEYLGFIDADGDLPPTLLRAFVGLIGKERPDVALGSKRHPDSWVIYPALRRIYSWVYQQLVRMMFRLSVRDTQTGIKFIRRDVLADALPKMAEKRFAFDLELLVVARQLGYGHIAELPVAIGPRFGSTVSLRAAYNTLLDTCAIFYRLHFLRYYGARHQRPIVPLDEVESAIQAIQPSSAGAVTSSAESIDENVDGEGSLRILLFNWRDISHAAAGGAEVYAHEVCREWVKAGHLVTFFTSRVDGCPPCEEIDGIRIVRHGGPLTVYREARRFYRREGRGKFDLVVDAVNTRPFSCPSFVKDAPIVAIIHQVAREVWKHESSPPVALLGRFVLEPWWLRKFRDVPVITVSPSSRKSLQEHGLRRVTVVPEGVRTLGVRTLGAQREERPTVAFMGRLTGNKRPGDAIEAIRLLRQQLPDAQMWVIGTGRLEPHLRRLHVPGVSFLGRVSETVKQERLARAHALVATSVREGWGLMVTEAAAHGTPAIAYDVPGLRDSVAASGGLVVQATPSALADALAQHLPRWVAGEMPPVTPNGVITWSEVASEILRVVGAEYEGAHRCRRRLGAGEVSYRNLLGRR